MGLQDKLQAKLAKAFDGKLADAVSVVEGSRSVNGAYDPELGGVVETTVFYAGRGIFGQYKLREIDGSRILATDVMLTALQSELFMQEGEVATINPAEPAIGDQVNGYRVMNVGSDPVKATWTLQLRK